MIEIGFLFVNLFVVFHTSTFSFGGMRILFMVIIRSLDFWIAIGGVCF